MNRWGAGSMMSDGDASESRGGTESRTGGQKKKKENPFVMPSDREIFSLREEERKKKREERKKLQQMSVMDKTTSLSRSVRTRLRVDDDEDFDLRQTFKPQRDIFDPSREDPSTVPQFDPNRERETLSEFIAKKREMFLLQMALDNKREEIERLDREAREEEEELRLAEQKLEESAAAFDEFLKQNDLRAAEAAGAAEKETKLKQEKQAEIKRLTAMISSIRSDIAKIEDGLSECQKYKDFLDRLTPEEWIAAQKAKPAGRKDKDKEKEMPMYFTTPQQLLDIFSQLEESNLFLIQNMQETETALEEMRQKFSSTRSAMEAETEALSQQVSHMDELIRDEEDRRQALRERTEKKGTVAQQEDELKRLSERVALVYVECGFDNDANLSTLQMLGNIEHRLGELFTEIDSMPPEEVERMEKANEKARRLLARQARNEAKAREQEERIRRAQQRAMAAPTKRVGKPVMFRSYIQRKTTKSGQEKRRQREEEDDIREFFQE